MKPKLFGEMRIPHEFWDGTWGTETSINFEIFPQDHVISLDIKEAML